MQQIDLADIASRPDWKDLLFSTVKEQELDPWDVDITRLILLFVDKIKEMREMNLWVPANAILAASILLRMKSDAWTIRKQDVSLFIPDQILFEEPVDVDSLMPVARETTRKISLDELMVAVEDIISRERKKALKKKREPDPIPEYLFDLTDPDSDDFKERVEGVYSRIMTTLDSGRMTLFSNLLSECSRLEVINTLLPLLYLASQDKVRIWQEDSFGDIFIEPVNA